MTQDLVIQALTLVGYIVRKEGLGVNIIDVRGTVTHLLNNAGYHWQVYRWQSSGSLWGFPLSYSEVVGIDALLAAVKNNP